MGGDILGFLCRMTYGTLYTFVPRRKIHINEILLTKEKANLLIEENIERKFCVKIFNNYFSHFRLLTIPFFFLTSLTYLLSNYRRLNNQQ